MHQARTAIKSMFRRLGYVDRVRILLPALAAGAVIAFMAHHSASGQETLDSYSLSRSIQQGRNAAPVTLDLQGKLPLLVYLGSFLVNAHGGCNDCHTCPSYRGTDPYKVGGRGLANGPTPVNSLNYLAGGTPFQNGAIISPSLTPDSSGHPGGMTYAEFKSAMRDGQDAHNSAHILQVMPWPTFRNMYDNELIAIYAYLSSIPPAASGQGQCTAPGQTR